MTNDAEHLIAPQPFNIPPLKLLCLDMYPLFTWIICFFISSFLSSSYILDISHLQDVDLMKIFSHSIEFHFVLITVPFALLKLFGFMSVYQLFILVPSLCPVQKLGIVPCDNTFMNIPYSLYCWVQHIIFLLKCLTHMNLTIVQYDRHSTLCILLDADTQVVQHILVEYAVCFPIYIYDLLIKNQVSIDVCIYVLVFHSILATNLSVLMPISHGFYYYNCVEQLEIRYGNTLYFFLLFKFPWVFCFTV